jgi:cell wall-associated NlpC family hydrolase
MAGAGGGPTLNHHSEPHGFVKFAARICQEEVKVEGSRADGPSMNRTARIILATGVALTVVVPAFGGAAAAAPAPGPATTTVDTRITVREGDSLAGLAWRHGVRLSALLSANSLQLTSIIHPGDTLVIPAGATPPTTGGTTSRTASPASAPTTGASATDYVVRSGDGLAGIAWRHGVTLGALVKANGIATTSLIVPGQRLVVPPATRPIPTAVTAASTAGAAPSPGAPSTVPGAGVVAAPAPVAATQGSSLQTLLSYATAQVGVPYRFYSAGPEAFDCSGLVVAAFRQIGMNVPHQSRALARLGQPVDWRTGPIAAGDLVFTSAVGDPELITHVGIALDSRRWVHAVGFGRTVSITALPATDRIMAVQRIALP